MGLLVQLLGPPVIRLGSWDAPLPRDRKTWGALAYLLLSERPPSRQQLAELLFPEVNDPLAAVRWVLASVRRLLGGEAALEGDPVGLRRPAGMVVDTDIVTTGRWSEAVSLPNVDRELLEGVNFDALPAFELWLTGERRRRPRPRCCVRRRWRAWHGTPVGPSPMPNGWWRWTPSTRTTMWCWSRR